MRKHITSSAQLPTVRCSAEVSQERRIHVFGRGDGENMSLTNTTAETTTSTCTHQEWQRQGDHWVLKEHGHSTPNTNGASIYTEVVTGFWPLPHLVLFPLLSRDHFSDGTSKKVLVLLFDICTPNHYTHPTRQLANSIQPLGGEP